MAPATSPPGRWAWAPVKSPSRQGLAASLSRRGCPAWSCVRHGSRLRLLPCPPAALLPPPPPAPRNLRPLAFPPRLPALPASPAPATVGERLGGGGPERTAIGVRGGGAGKPSPPSPHQPERGRGPETSRPPRPLPRGPPSRAARSSARLGDFYLKAGAPCPEPRAVPGRADRVLLQVLQTPSTAGRLLTTGFPPLPTQRGGVTALGSGHRPQEKVAQYTPKERVLHLLLRAHTHPEPTWNTATTTPNQRASPDRDYYQRISPAG